MAANAEVAKALLNGVDATRAILSQDPQIKIIVLTSYGRSSGFCVDPIEKKPFFHAYPGALAYSFGMLGCDYHCDYCQNWITSQAVRDPAGLGKQCLMPPMHPIEITDGEGAGGPVSRWRNASNYLHVEV